MSKSPETIVFMLGNSLAVGEQLSGQECPFCARLGHKENSLSISRELNAVVFQCHRAKCGAKGYVRADGGRVVSDKAKAVSKWAAFLAYSTPLLDAERAWVKGQWGFEDRHLRKGMIEYSPAGRRLILPIFNGQGEEVGASLRTTTSTNGPKSMIVMTKQDELCMSFYKGERNTDTLIVVEDQASAIRASMYCSSVALLGVYMDAIRARRLGAQQARRVLWCLDKDAFQKTVQYTTKFAHLVRGSTAICPPKDLKNMTEKELQEFLTNDCRIELAEEQETEIA